MNKLTLSCLKSLVEFRPKGDWDFLTQLVLVWPEARAFYWNKQGFRSLLSSWPFSRRKHKGMISSFLWPGVEVPHGFEVECGLLKSAMRIHDQGELLLCIVYETSKMTQWNNATWEVWSHHPTYPVFLPMNKESFEQHMKGFPMIKQNVLKALILAGDLGKTRIKALNELAALTHKSLNRDSRHPEKK